MEKKCSQKHVSKRKTYMFMWGIHCTAAYNINGNGMVSDYFMSVKVNHYSTEYLYNNTVHVYVNDLITCCMFPHHFVLLIFNSVLVGHSVLSSSAHSPCLKPVPNSLQQPGRHYLRYVVCTVM